MEEDPPQDNTKRVSLIEKIAYLGFPILFLIIFGLAKLGSLAPPSFNEILSTLFFPFTIIGFFMIVFVGATAGIFLLGIIISIIGAFSKNMKRRKYAILGIILNLGTLIYFESFLKTVNCTIKNLICF